MPQHTILQFEKHKGNPARPLEAHHEQQKEQYASNPNIDTTKSKHNFHIVKLEGRYYHFIKSHIEQAVSLSKQAVAIEKALEGIGPLNAGKKKEEALAMLKKWFPQMENFTGQLKSTRSR